ncbi:MAG TPA: hypothetical protein PKL25_10235, partial [Phycicoccus elongatus]|nr:hypothetical protein [Phycicoccus elongatus]
MTPEQDRAALESTPRPAGSERDRRVHGLATAGFGAIVGAYVGITQALPRDNGAVSLITAGYVGLLIALAFWQKRAARTVPRHANLIGYVGLAGTLCLAFVGVVGLTILENVTGERATPSGPSGSSLNAGNVNASRWYGSDSRINCSESSRR